VNTQHAQRILFEQLKRTIPISAIVARYNIELKRQSSGTLQGRCPVHHGSNPRQFVVDETKGLWNCFSPSCKRGGDIFNLVAELEKIDVRNAALLIAEWFAIKPGGEVQHRKPKERAMTTGALPSHKVFLVEDRGEDKDSFWHRVGSAWPSKDGKGLQIQFPPGLSVAGRVVLREYTTEDQAEDEKKAAKYKKK
jgi:hypothetical protein